MAKRAVIIDLVADASAFRKGTRQAADAADDLGSRVQSLGRTIVSTYAAKAVIDFGVAATKAAADDAAAQQRLATALRNTTSANDAQIASVEEWIASTAVQLGFADDQLRPAFATLAAATKDAAEAQDLMALAMDTARAKGLPLETVAAALAKAHSGNTAALTKLVPGLREAGESTLSFATATERLNEQVRGQADAFAATDAGKLERMNVQWAEMQEQIGASLLPVMGALLDIVGGLFEWFGNLDEGTQQLIITVGLVAGGLYAAVSAAAAMKTAVMTLGITSQTAMPWLLGLSAAVVAVVAAVEIFGDEETGADRATAAMSKSVATASKSLDAHELSLLSAAEAATKYANALFAGNDEAVREEIRGNALLQQGLAELGIGMEDVVAATHSEIAAQEMANRVRAIAAERGYDLSMSIFDVSSAEDEVALQVGQVVGLLDRQSEAASRTTDENLRLAAAGDLASASALKASPAFDTLTETEQAMVEALLDTAPALSDVTDEMADAGPVADTTARRVLGLRDAFAGLLRSIADRQSVRDMQDAFDALKRKAEEAFVASAEGSANAEQAQRDYAGSIDDMKRRVIEFADSLGNVPKETVSAILADIDEGSIAQAEAALLALERQRRVMFSAVLDPATDQITIGSLGKIKLMAGGGTLRPGEWGIVGETGQPEIVSTPTVLQGPAKVTGVNDTARILRRRGGSQSPPPVVVNMHNTASPDEVAKAIAWQWRFA